MLTFQLKNSNIGATGYVEKLIIRDHTVFY